MSKEQKQALNLYGILDNEMSRMHALMQTYLTLPREDNYSRGGLANNGAFGSSVPVKDLSTIYKRILEMQDLLLKAVVSHDKIIQDKVAELALTGDADEK